MDCKVILSPRAIQDLREIVRYISLDDAHSAEKFGYALIDAARSLGKLPERVALCRNSPTARRASLFTVAIGLFTELTPSRKQFGFPDFGIPREGPSKRRRILAQR